MRVERAVDAAEFLARSSSLRAREPVLTNVMGTVAQMVVAGREFEQQWWWLVLDEAGLPVGCAMRTAPWNLVLGPMPSAAAEALATAVPDADPELPGVSGPAAVAAAFAAAIPGGRSLDVTMRDVVLVLDELVDPVGVPGAMRVAEPSELDLLIAWHEQFAVDAKVPFHDLEGSVRTRLAARSLLWWTVDDEPVSMAGHTQPVEVPGGAVGRIGPVFTPSEHRGRGYASALTAGVVRLLQPSCSVVMLFADAENPTSNGVYERIGFRRVDEIVEATLGQATLGHQ